MISNKVMKTNEYDNAVWYRVACDCGDPRCDLTLEFEHDDRFGDMVFMNMYKNLYWSSYWQSNNPFKNIWLRIKGAFKILFTGYVKIEESFVFKGAEHLDSLVLAIKEGQDKIIASG